MSERRAKNKLSIYLLKNDYSDNFLKENQGLHDYGNGIYTTYTPNNTPNWVTNFFVSQELDLTTKSVAALFKTKIDVNQVEKHFVLCFGTGHHKLNPDAYEKRFRLKTALSMGDVNQIRALNKKDISGSPKISQEQLAKLSTINSFGVDIQHDILQGITLSLNQKIFKKEQYGKTLVGRDSLNITVANNINNIHELLQILYAHYSNEAYKNKGYDWVDYISPVKTPDEINSLDNNLFHKIRESNIELNLAPPELIDWDNFQGFSADPVISDNTQFFDEIELKNFISEEDSVNINTIQAVKEIKINMILSEDNSIEKSWTLYNCINAEIDHDEKKYILSDGNWYKVEDNYLQELESWWANLNIQTSSLPDYTKFDGRHSEGRYNEIQSNDYELLDKKLVTIPHQSSIEVCDLYKNGNFIHVKIYKNSADMSHLMAQALVSSDLFLGNKRFRELFNEKLEDKLSENELQKPTRTMYKITLAVIHNKENFDLPFFTKVNLRTNMNHIEMLDLTCCIETIKGNY
ncbi:DUF6119 family protein [Carnobacterium maltaromaticum]|uniref:DUF6119 family protein n=1 Tax=Carnobacterium maltaromaticum TaxID=2751 RepID=UPI0010718633|nr:DUF6119 family protein [Carnobacterium maltaromaticum]TFJ72074.1 hypothetical protein CKN94_12840 [Carnobacterium maltaromaticum]TFJ76987.1 hypothetical protein CKN97_12830 [Carnobacterium maltaromaticum]